MPALYDLTKFTGSRKNDDRRMVIATVEADRRSLIVTGIGFISSLPVVLVLTPFFGGWALLAILAGMPIAHVLASRRRDGLQVSNLHALNDSIGARYGRSAPFGGAKSSDLQRKTGIVILAGQPLTKPKIIELIPSVIENPEYRGRDQRDIDGLIPGPGLDTHASTPSDPRPIPAHALARRPEPRTAHAARPSSELFLP